MKLQKWVRDLLIIPTIVGLIGVGAQSISNLIMAKRPDLDIFVEEPVSFREISALLRSYLNPVSPDYAFTLGWDLNIPPDKNIDEIPKVSLTHKNKKPASPSITGGNVQEKYDDIYAFRVQITNTGTPLKNIVTNVEFDTDDSQFRVITYSRKTNPKSIADNIEVLDKENIKSIKFKIPSLNPTEEYSITVLLNKVSKYSVVVRSDNYTKSESWGPSEKADKQKWYFFGLTALFGAVLSMSIRYILKYRVNKDAATGAALDCDVLIAPSNDKSVNVKDLP